jgi:hypothetical protein
MREAIEIEDARAQRRRMRRLKRSARMIAPFLGIPLLLGTLALSVDLIEYQPVTSSRERLSDIPVRRMAKPIPTRVATDGPVRVSNRGPESASPTAPGDVRDPSADSNEFDVTLPTTPLRPPTPPYALQRP